MSQLLYIALITTLIPIVSAVDLPTCTKKGAEGAPMPVVFANHWGGPRLVLGNPNYKSLITWMKQAGSDLPRPSAILVVAAHWEETQATVNTGERPSLLYDDPDFPPESYTFSYPAPGAPDLAQKVVQRLRDAGIPCAENSSRGWDVAAFVPLAVMYPAADIPVIQLSLVKGLEPKLHIAIGKAIAEFRQEGVLILCSGSTYHNIPTMLEGGGTEDASEFDDYLVKACCGTQGTEREQLLADWESAPGGKACQPSKEHIIPLLVAAGAAGEDSGCHVYSGIMSGLTHSSFQFGGRTCRNRPADLYKRG